MKRQGAINGAILAAQLVVFVVGAVSLYHQGTNTLLFITGIIVIGGIGGYVYPSSIEWAWKQLVRLSHMPE